VDLPVRADGKQGRDGTAATDSADNSELVAKERIFRQCECCGAPIEITLIESGDRRRGVLWSDGYLENDDAPTPSILGKCRVCGAMGCLVELPLMEDAAHRELTDDYTAVPLTVDEYAALLENLEEIGEQFHCYLRISFWQLSNHRRRHDGADEPLSEFENANLQGLRELLDEDDPAERLIKVEVLRQLQQFERAEALLAEPVHPEIVPLVERLWQLLEARDANLVKLFTGEPGDEMPAFLSR